MIKLSNIAAAYAALRGRDSLKTDTQRRVHDFMEYLPPEHKTPRRILQHLNYTLACDDIGGTAFCLWAMYEGFANMANPIVHRRMVVQEIWPDNALNQDQAKKEASEETRRWLNSVVEDPSIRLGEGSTNGLRYLVVAVKTNSLEIIVTKDGLTWLKIPNYNVLIDPYFKGTELRLSRLAIDGNKQKIDADMLQKDEGFLAVKPLKGHYERVNDVNYAKCWLNLTREGKNNYGRIPSQKSNRVNDLELEELIKNKGQIILDKIKGARHAYAHDFQKLAADQQWSSTQLAYEFFDVFEPIFRELVRERYPEDNFGCSKTT